MIPSTKITAINLGSWLVEPGRDTVDSNLFLINDDAGAKSVRVTPVTVR